jgi:hypothetical protein
MSSFDVWPFKGALLICSVLVCALTVAGAVAY